METRHRTHPLPRDPHKRLSSSPSHPSAESSDPAAVPQDDQPVKAVHLPSLPKDGPVRLLLHIGRTFSRRRGLLHRWEQRQPPSRIMMVVEMW